MVLLVLIILVLLLMGLSCLHCWMEQADTVAGLWISDHKMVITDVEI